MRDKYDGLIRDWPYEFRGPDLQTLVSLNREFGYVFECDADKAIASTKTREEVSAWLAVRS